MTKLRLLLLAPVLAVGLAGCTASAQVQQYTEALCGFLPTATAIGNILHASPKATTYEQVAQLICATVAPPVSAKTFGAAASHPIGATFSVYIKGVKVTGHFVR